VPQQIQDRNSGWPQTLHGAAHVEEPTPNDDSWEPRFVPIGARVGKSGQVFETDGHAGRGGLVVKLFTWAAEQPAQVVRDFTREAMRVADLHHPHVAQVLDAGTLGDGTPFVVMERLAGMTLDEAVSGRSLPMAEVLPILRGVGSALGAAHAVGIAHRQLRADNVFVADVARYGSGSPKLLDFGVARLVAGTRAIGRDAHGLGRRAGERADQLALATLAWRLLGAMPAPAIQRVLLRAMSPDPSQRFGSVTALVEALDEASVNAATAGLTTNLGPVRTLVGATIPVSPSRLAPVVVAPASGLPAGRPPTGAPTPRLANVPSSLTQQFFAEGEQLEMEHAAGQTSGARAVPERDELGELETSVASRVPRSRTQMTAAALLALASVAIIGWTIVSLASKPAGDPPAANASPAAVVGRPVAVPPAGALRSAGAADRGPGGKTMPVRRAPSVQPPPFAASPLPARQVPAPPPAPATPAEAAPRTGDQAAPHPGVAPAESSDDDEPRPGEQEGAEPRGATPPPRAPEEPVPAPRAWGEVSPAPSAAEAPAPSTPAAP
jgi:hypothetical protein